jgi:LysR family carnitine catabolism transcriptional activator
MNVSPRQLRIFVSLAQSLNFSRTAEQFCVAQPTLSKIVREIEQEVGIQLFERTTRSVKLTADGEALVGVAIRLTQEFAVGLAEFEDVARRRIQRLSIAALPTLAAMVLPGPVAALRAEMPNAFIRIHDVFTDQALDLLRARKVDLALTGVDVVHRDLDYEEIVCERFVLLSSGQHPNVRKLRSWSEEAIGALPIITMPHGTGTRQVVEEAFISKGLSFRPCMELTHLTSIAKFVKAGCGVAVLPLSGAQLMLDDGLFITSLVGAPERSIGIVTRRDTELPPLAAKMVRSIRQSASSLGIS